MQLSLEQLARLEAAWRRVRAPIVDHLAPGLSRAELERAFSAYPALNPPEELFIWWGWHNGGGGQMLGGWREFFSVNDALEFYSETIDSVRPDLLPLTNERPWVHIECASDSPKVGKIIGFDTGEPLTTWCASLGELVETWIGFIDADIWTYDPSARHQNKDLDGVPDGHIAFNVA